MISEHSQRKKFEEFKRQVHQNELVKNKENAGADSVKLGFLIEDFEANHPLTGERLPIYVCDYVLPVKSLIFFLFKDLRDY